MTDQSVDIPFVAGIGEDVDVRIAPAGVLAAAQNVEPQKTGLLAKRHGFERASRTQVPSGSYPGRVRRIFRHGEDEAILADRYDEDAQNVPPDINARLLTATGPGRTWVGARVGYETSNGEPGTLPVVGRERVRHLRYVTASTGSTSSDVRPYAAVAALGEYELYAYETATDVCRIDLYSARSGMLLATTTAGTSVTQVRAWVWSDTKFGVGWISTATRTIHYATIDPELLLASVAVYNLSGMVVTAPIVAGIGWDVVRLGDPNEDWAVFVLAHVDPLTYPEHAAVQAGTAPAAAVYSSSYPAVAAGGVCITAMERASSGSDPSAHYAIGFIALDGSTKVSFWRFSSTHVLTEGNTYQVEAAPASTPTRMSIGIANAVAQSNVISDPDTVYLAYDYADVKRESLHSMVFAIVVEGSGLFSLATHVGIAPASAFFCCGNTPLFFARYNYPSTLQRGIYLYAVADNILRICGRQAWGSGYDPLLTYPIPRPSSGDLLEYVTAWNEIDEAHPYNSPIAAGYALRSHVFDVASNLRALQTSCGGSVLAAGMPLHFDGARVAEVGWLQWPPRPTVSETPGTGVLAGVYSYVAVYEEVDQNGDLHQSAPSIAESNTLAAESVVSVEVESPRATLRTQWKSLRIGIYRTLDGGTLYYRAGHVPATAPGSSATFTDTVPDANLAGREVLRSSAGAREEFAPPASEGACEHGRRAWLASGDRVFFSHEYLRGFGHGFCAENYVQLREPVTALVSSGDALVVFSERACWAVWGDGPDRIGTGSFNLPSWIADVGAPRALGGARSTARIRIGIVWRGGDGIYALRRGSPQPTRISDPIRETLETYPIVAYAIDDERAGVVRFGVVASEATDAASLELCWWYDTGEIWTINTLPIAGRHSAVQIGASRSIATQDYGTVAPQADAGVYRLSTSMYADYRGASVSAIEMVVETRPIYPHGRNGESRIRRVFADGQRVGASTSLRIVGYHDDRTADARDYTLQGTGELALQYDCQYQRGTSIRIRMSESSSTSGAELAGITIVHEPYGERRLGASRRG